MAHLLMLESWVGGTGRLLPSAIIQLGHRYTFVTRNREHYRDPLGDEVHPVLVHAAAIIECETNDPQTLFDVVQEHHARNCFDGVITICDYYIDQAVELATALNLPCPFPRQVARIRNKASLRQLLDAAGLPNPRFFLTDTWEETKAAASELGYPLVIKPTDLASSAHVRRIDNESALKTGFTTLKRFSTNFREQPRDQRCLLEAFLDGPEISVEASTIAGTTTIVAVTDKSVTGAPYFIEDGHMVPAPLDVVTLEAATRLVTQALKAVGFDHGISHTEIKLTAAGPRIVEINPRIGGNYIAELVNHVTGIDLLAAMIDLALGKYPRFESLAPQCQSAAIAFIVPQQAGRIVDIAGEQAIAINPHILRWSINPVVGKEIDTPIDNACYLGHIVAVDRVGLNARAYAEQAVKSLRFTFDNQPLEERHR